MPKAWRRHEGDNRLSQQPPTRQAVLIAYAEQQRLRTGMSKEAWAECIDTAYCERVPREQRTLPAPDLAQVTDADDWTKLRRAWDQQIRRYVAGERAFPSELEEAWIAALDEPYRTDCVRELAQRVGLYGALRREPGSTGDGRSWGAVLEGFSQVTQDMAAILDDGRIDDRDMADLPRLVEHVARMQADLESLRLRAEGVMRRANIKVAS